MRRPRIAAALAAAAASLIFTTGAAARAERECASTAAQSALAPEAFDALWQRRGPGWTGGDGARSLRLPDGRVLWTFGDTYLGTVRANGTRPADAPLVENTVVVQDGACLTTHHGGTRDEPAPFIAARDPEHWLWPGDAVVEQGHVRIVMAGFERSSNGWFDHRGDWVATLSLPQLELTSLVRLGTPAGVMWGESVVVDGAWTYVYGIEFGDLKKLHVARAPTGSLGSPSEWRFHTGRGWSPDPARSLPFADGIAGADVVPVDQGFLLITQRQKLFASKEVYVRRSLDPFGPWSRSELLTTIPPLDPGLFAYGVTAHPAFTEAGTMLLGYSVNAFEIERVYRDVDAYRPRFVSVQIPVWEPPAARLWRSFDFPFSS